MYPQFVDGPNGRLFLALYLPEKEITGNWVLHVPAFAEEMNRCRPMVSLQARALADIGAVVVSADLYGTGDSEGDFADATWGAWIADLRFLLDWMIEKGAESITLWGVRTGCLLAVDLLAGSGREYRDKVKQLLFWQPVASGELFLNQFLRVQVASSMMAGEKLTVADLRETLRSGHGLEIAGYSLNPELVSDLDQVSLKTRIPRGRVQVSWFEIGANPAKSISPAAKNVMEMWNSHGVPTTPAAVQGEPFWSTQEISMAPVLIDRSTAEFETSAASAIPAALRLPDHRGQGAETATTFDCEGSALIGILHRSNTPAKKGVLLVVGGPQYRVGSHRQFLLLSRHLATNGIPVFRFDYRGMGDSSGPYKGFESIKEDIRNAIDCFQGMCPGLEQVVVWGLCDAATAATFYAATDSRVSGLVLVNPWARSQAGEARTLLKHYYLQRVVSKAFWRKCLNGEFNVRQSLGELLSNLYSSANVAERSKGSGKSPADRTTNPMSDYLPLIERMYRGLDLFRGKVLFLISGNDLTAAEFVDALAQSKRFRKLVKQSSYRWLEFEEADHTFSRAQWREEVAVATAEWVRNID